MGCTMSAEERAALERSKQIERNLKVSEYSSCSYFFALLFIAIRPIAGGWRASSERHQTAPTRRRRVRQKHYRQADEVRFLHLLCFYHHVTILQNHSRIGLHARRLQTVQARSIQQHSAVAGRHSQSDDQPQHCLRHQRPRGNTACLCRVFYANM